MSQNPAQFVNTLERLLQQQQINPGSPGLHEQLQMYRTDPMHVPLLLAALGSSLSPMASLYVLSSLEYLTIRGKVDEGTLCAVGDAVLSFLTSAQSIAPVYARAGTSAAALICHCPGFGPRFLAYVESALSSESPLPAIYATTSVVDVLCEKWPQSPLCLSATHGETRNVILQWMPSVSQILISLLSSSEEVSSAAATLLSRFISLSEVDSKWVDAGPAVMSVLFDASSDLSRPAVAEAAVRALSDILARSYVPFEGGAQFLSTCCAALSSLLGTAVQSADSLYICAVLGLLLTFVDKHGALLLSNAVIESAGALLMQCASLISEAPMPKQAVLLILEMFSHVTEELEYCEAKNSDDLRSLLDSVCSSCLACVFGDLYSARFSSSAEDARNELYVYFDLILDIFSYNPANFLSAIRNVLSCIDNQAAVLFLSAAAPSLEDKLLDGASRFSYESFTVIDRLYEVICKLPSSPRDYGHNASLCLPSLLSLCTALYANVEHSKESAEFGSAVHAQITKVVQKVCELAVVDVSRDAPLYCRKAADALSMIMHRVVPDGLQEAVRSVLTSVALQCSAQLSDEFVCCLGTSLFGDAASDLSPEEIAVWRKKLLEEGYGPQHCQALLVAFKKISGPQRRKLSALLTPYGQYLFSQVVGISEASRSGEAPGGTETTFSALTDLINSTDPSYELLTSVISHLTSSVPPAATCALSLDLLTAALSSAPSSLVAPFAPNLLTMLCTVLGSACGGDIRAQAGALGCPLPNLEFSMGYRDEAIAIATLGCLNVVLIMTWNVVAPNSCRSVQREGIVDCSELIRGIVGIVCELGGAVNPVTGREALALLRSFASRVGVNVLNTLGLVKSVAAAPFIAATCSIDLCDAIVANIEGLLKLRIDCSASLSVAMDRLCERGVGREDAQKLVSRFDGNLLRSSVHALAFDSRFLANAAIEDFGI